MELYNKAKVYCSELSDEKHLEYLQKLQKLFSDELVQKIMAGGTPTSPTSETVSTDSQQKRQEESKTQHEAPKKNSFEEKKEEGGETELLEEDS